MSLPGPATGPLRGRGVIAPTVPPHPLRARCPPRWPLPRSGSPAWDDSPSWRSFEKNQTGLSLRSRLHPQPADGLPFPAPSTPGRGIISGLALTFLHQKVTKNVPSTAGEAAKGSRRCACIMLTLKSNKLLYPPPYPEPSLTRPWSGRWPWPSLPFSFCRKKQRPVAQPARRPTFSALMPGLQPAPCCSAVAP